MFGHNGQCLSTDSPPKKTAVYALIPIHQVVGIQTTALIIIDNMGLRKCPLKAILDYKVIYLSPLS